ncbi:3-dehydroquinate synthase [Aquibacillus sp. 3ASR75-11]|uniref:3-dehydroquinate synthase n=1 Tax=Terrihalobacillus insolitus TaxID=2950438 RepID=A0A9X4ALV9_9BACI|nr:3-dehydroquinate synthase [Terrihalobacillus insolitus]MDC3413050.1 3-dehydroquinate synthase [Terrihalobacillus insolitus]MDC3424792.1 3-dehydroquinate synthase [Terrihalobacillus insolitus]
MESLQVQSYSNSYTVYVGANVRHRLASLCNNNYQTILIITDTTIENLYLEDVKHSFSADQNVHTAVIPAGESSKSHDVYFRLLTKAIDCGLDRKSLIVALGGGVVGDLAGFVAATYMRGIDYIQVPTTILAHDSSVGGKVAINHPKGKNLIGSFYPPAAVVYDVETLHSLSKQEIRSGYAEIVKHALIDNASFFQDVVQHRSIYSISNEVLIDHLLRGIKVKASIVQEDEKESNIRMFLNFGHTLGHALESELGYGKISHGEAVAIGMLFAIKVSEDLLSISLPYNELYDWLKENEYPLRLSYINPTDLLEKMKLDKKAHNQKIQMVLLEKIGCPKAVQVDHSWLLKKLTKFLEEMTVE